MTGARHRSRTCWLGIARGVAACLAVAWMLPGVAQIQSALTVPVDAGFAAQNITSALYILEDREAGLGVSDLVQPEVASRFKLNGKDTVHMGRVAYPLWLRLTLENNGDLPVERRIIVHNPRLSIVECYRPAAGEHPIGRAGTLIPYFEWPLLHLQPAFSVTLPPHSTDTLYLRVRQNGSMRFTVGLYTLEGFRRNAARLDFNGLVFIGALLGFGIYHLYLYAGLRERSYFYLALFIFAFMIYRMTMNGAATVYLWPNWPWFCDRAMTIFGMLTLAMGTIFSTVFLQTRAFAPALSRVIDAMLVFTLGVMMLGFTDFEIKHYFSHGISILIPFCLFAAGIVAYRRGHRQALLYLLAWTIMMIGSVTIALLGGGFIPYNTFTEHLIEGGFVFAVLLWSFALTRRVKEREEALRKRLEEEIIQRSAELKAAQERVETLTSLLPICSACKKVRDDEGHWDTVEHYLGRQTGALVSHGLCPECLRKLYPEFVPASSSQRGASPAE